MKKETHQLQLYKENSMQRVYFATGAGLVLGSVLGGVHGLAEGMKRTLGKKEALKYFCARSAARLAGSMGIASYSFALTELLLSRVPAASQRALRMLQ
ncbi:uncharacterized protein NEMAJ01_1160 [Nematocida major]|uniref:uncharacterized protein n=1 Tax=Nematocida major TaxID=1912982 RepID=UPI0020087729|nr:uncharacterized protein NEMAJ01_1160 [Nematocida major]KAH9386264.1 hypothetical protein NEMAJ01_1160 [Nematocida major]